MEKLFLKFISINPENGGLDTQEISTTDKIKSLEIAIKDNQNALDNPIMIEELQEKLTDLKNGKACGIDGIRTEMLKHSSNKLKLAILTLFNLVLKSGIYHTTWNQGFITPIFKSGDNLNPNNYRGICVNSNLGKLFCSILNSRILSYLTDNNVSSKSQIGFIPKHRTTDHIFTLHTLIQNHGKYMLAL